MLIKYFIENNNDDFIKYNELWSKSKIIFLNPEIKSNKNILKLFKDIEKNPDCKILGIVYPTYYYVNNSDLLKRLKKGDGINYTGNKVWYPEEIWIYHPINDYNI